jgi:hypothetical protein
MNNLQDVLDNFMGSKLGKMKDFKIRQTVMGMNMQKNLVKDDLFESKRINGVKSSTKMKENGLKQLELINQRSRENQVCCPNCGTYGKKILMEKHHFDNCKRPFGFSDDKIYQLHLEGQRNLDIAIMCNLKPNSVCKIIKKFKKDFVD